jgi:WD40-like Beta Propeller Repeat
MVPSPDGKHTLIQSFADPAHPVTLYSLSLTARIVKFISATEIGYTTNSLPDSPNDGVTTIWRMSLKDMRPLSVVRLQGDALDVAWSPDGSNVAFIAYPTVPGLLSVNRLWLKVGSASPRALTPLIEFGGRGVSSSDEVIVRFSPDGKYLLMVDTFFAGSVPKSTDQEHFQVRSVPDGTLVWVPPGTPTGSWTTMAVWSHLTDRLYYNGAGVQTWDALTNVVGTLVGLSWDSPSVSTDDHLVAYGTSGTDGKPHVEVRALLSGSVRVLPGILGRPILLSDEVMIEEHFVVDSTGMGPPYAPDRYFVLNLSTNKETPLPASFNCVPANGSPCPERRPIEVWPH